MATGGFTLSYIITTKNRLPFLKILFGKLLPQLHADEEIVVVDSSSTDGSKEYLQGLFSAGKIHQFISEPDNNQAHGWNKALLMASAPIIKKLIDDDVHHFASIRKCRDFMLANLAIDICISNNLEGNLDDPDIIQKAGRLSHYQQWKRGSTKAFTFGDVYMLLRKSSLSYLGLYDTQFKMIDWEYSLRVSFLGARIAYYTGYNSLTVSTPGNISSTAGKKLFEYEGIIGKIKYGYPGDNADMGIYSAIKVWIGRTWYNFKNRKRKSVLFKLPPEAMLRKYYTAYYDKLEEQNKAGVGEFIY